MVKRILLPAMLALAAATFAAPSWAGPSQSDIWQVEACGNDPSNACERAFMRLCGKTPNAGCVKRNQKTFDKASRSRR